MSNVVLGDEVCGIYIRSDVPNVIDIVRYLEDNKGVYCDETFDRRFDPESEYCDDFIFLIRGTKGYLACFGSSPQENDREVQSLQDFTAFYEMPKTKLGGLL